MQQPVVLAFLLFMARVQMQKHWVESGEGEIKLGQGASWLYFIFKQLRLQEIPKDSQTLLHLFTPISYWL